MYHTLLASDRRSVREQTRPKPGVVDYALQPVHQNEAEDLQLSAVCVHVLGTR